MIDTLAFLSLGLPRSFFFAINGKKNGAESKKNEEWG